MPNQQTQRQHRLDSIKWLSEELRDAVFYVDDPETKRAIYEWLRRASRLPGGSVMDLVENHLSQVRRDDDSEGMVEFPMRRLDGDGTEAFPDSCKGCDHYGTRCPIFVDPVERDRRERLQERMADASPSEVRQAYRRYAEANGCHQITQALTEHFESYQELIAEGLDLYEQADVDLGFTDEEAEAVRATQQAVGGTD